MLRATCISLVVAIAMGCGDGNVSGLAATGAAVLAAAALSSGNSSTTSSPTAVSNSTTPTSPQLTSTGGTASLKDTADITFPSGALSAPRDVKLTSISQQTISAQFKETASIFAPSAEHVAQLKVSVTGEQPKKAVTAKLVIPFSFASTVPDGSEIRVFYLNVYNDGNKVLETFEPTSARAGKGASSIEVTLPPEAFAPDASGRVFEATILLAATPTAPSGTNPKEVYLPPVSKADAGACAGSSISSPIDNGVVTSAYGPRAAPVNGASTFHRGVDFRASEGTTVKAAAAGKVEVLTQRKNGSYSGWGYYIIIRHEDGGATLYAHLKDQSAVVPTGTRVNSGDSIALSGNTGTGSAPHLHFEYAPNGKIFDKGEKVDPVPCFSSTASGSIAVSDNGSIADDAFSVSLNGTVICTTSIGATNSCSMGQLRPGSYTLLIITTIAPDNVGTYSITISSASMTIDGVKSVSGSLPQGGTKSYILLVAAK